MIITRIQLNYDTRERQMKMWSDLILAYSKSKGLYSISLGELYNSPITQNSEINRRLSMDSILQVSEWMTKNKFADFASASKEKIFVYWRSVQEVAEAIFKWADKNAKIGSVETLVDICEDGESKGEIFHRMPIEIVLKACQALQEVGKAEVKIQESLIVNIGVLFRGNRRYGSQVLSSLKIRMQRLKCSTSINFVVQVQ
ncbi:UNKNOWN [Stylonychia lemnae]|uniref:Vacuolar protein-sorting-associated protein 25 n=1 Tax=Stylonychia lemnae TaxID=5949 RepID=A0A078A9M6_STYLE|nr:UNKNOWN [Stylonychia lemnae]|eukprot:CDW78292.1 UNKNOWN [Stylonychia lemnae]